MKRESVVEFRTASRSPAPTPRPPVQIAILDYKPKKALRLRIENSGLSFNSPLCLRTVLIACNVKQMSKDIQPSFSAEDIAKIKKFSKTRSKVWCSSGI